MQGVLVASGVLLAQGAMKQGTVPTQQQIR